MAGAEGSAAARPGVASSPPVRSQKQSTDGVFELFRVPADGSGAAAWTAARRPSGSLVG
jgi:hypothetical protein